MSVDQIVENEVKENPEILMGINTNTTAEPQYQQPMYLFSQQYFEKPIVSDKYHAFRSPTMCTIKGVPAIDDF